MNLEIILTAMSIIEFIPNKVLTKRQLVDKLSKKFGDIPNSAIHGISRRINK
jgi:hypothetical protein